MVYQHHRRITCDLQDYDEEGEVLGLQELLIALIDICADHFAQRLADCKIDSASLSRSTAV